MKIFIRTDASYQIGTGHVMRCLTLADHLRRGGAEVTFICRDHPGFKPDAITDRDFELILMEYSEEGASNKDHTEIYKRWLAYPEEIDRDQTLAAIAQTERAADWLIVDHYGINAPWHTELRRAAEYIMVIDDLADRKLDCDLLLNQNCIPDLESKYEILVAGECRKLLGPDFAVIRQEFLEYREKAEQLRRDNHLFIFFGGSDLTGETVKTIEAINSLNVDITADIVIGAANQSSDKIKSLCEKNPGFTCHTSVDNMAELMAQASLAIGAGGTTTYERACLGIPTIFIAIAENQIPVSHGADIIGIGKYLGVSSEVTPEKIAGAVSYLLGDPDQLTQIRQNALRKVDGQGVERVVSANFEKRPVESPEP